MKQTFIYSDYTQHAVLLCDFHIVSPDVSVIVPFNMRFLGTNKKDKFVWLVSTDWILCRYNICKRRISFPVCSEIFTELLIRRKIWSKIFKNFILKKTIKTKKVILNSCRHQQKFEVTNDEMDIFNTVQVYQIPNHLTISNRYSKYRNKYSSFIFFLLMLS